MTPRERIIKAINHKEPDRVPIDLGGKNNTMIDEGYYRLKKYLGIHNQSPEEEFSSTYSVVVKFDERVLKRLNVDFRRVFLKGKNIELSRKPGQEYFTGVDEWGIGLRKISCYAEMVGHPLENASIDDLKDYPWPDPFDPIRTKGLREEAKRLYYDTDYAIISGEIGGGLFEYACWLRGMENYLVDMMLNKEFAIKLIEKIFEVEKNLWEVFLTAVGDYVQIVEVADDYGTQEEPMISPELFREIIKPYHKRLVSFIKEVTGGKVKVKHHTCGSVYDLVEDLIDCGVDVLNPVQPLAKNMKPEKLKPKFGKRICFHGGIDEQYVLPRGTVEEVREEVRRKINGFAKGGGYILSPAHCIQPDVPPENIVAMYDAAYEFGKYPLGIE